MKKKDAFSYKLMRWLGAIASHTILIFFTLLATFPIALVLINSFKTRKGIFLQTFALPIGNLFTLIGYDKVLSRTNFPLYFYNSLVVALVSMFLILLLGAMAAYALSEYKFKGNALIMLYIMAGLMIPIRLGTVSIMRLVQAMGLINTLTALILVNVASGLPTAVFILQQFMQQVPKEMKDAARIDGASEYKVFGLVIPLVKPAIAIVAVYSIVPIWNDLWFPLILAPSEKNQDPHPGRAALYGAVYGRLERSSFFPLTGYYSGVDSVYFVLAPVDRRFDPGRD